MMVPGSLTAAGEWSEASSLAREIEQQMIGQELINLDDETEEAPESRGAPPSLIPICPR